MKAAYPAFYRDFNPRAPHGARRETRMIDRDSSGFQSTRSAWSATFKISLSFYPSRFQSTRSAWSATRENHRTNGTVVFQSTRSAWSATRADRLHPLPHRISIHALRMERDRAEAEVWELSDRISIHALRMERDLLCAVCFAPGKNFNPRAPHGARPGAASTEGADLTFQSTRSAWSATRRGIDGGSGFDISIHALRMERDSAAPLFDRPVFISIHALRMERDALPINATSTRGGISIHALRMERDGGCLTTTWSTRLFQSTRSAWSATAVADTRRQ